MSNKGLDRRELLNRAMEEETWKNQRGKHKQQRDMQEFHAASPDAKLPIEGDKCWTLNEFRGTRDQETA